MNLLKSIQRWLFRNERFARDGLGVWRERILVSILAAALGLSMLAFLPALRMSIVEGLWTLVAANGAAIVLAAGLLIFSRLSFVLRAVGLLATGYAVGVVILVQAGFLSGGFAWLFCAGVLAGVLLGLKAALAGALLNAAIIGLLVFLASQGLLGEAHRSAPLMRVVAAGANFVFLNFVAAVSVAVLVNGLQALNQASERAKAALTAERAELLATREELRREIEVRKSSERELARSERKYRLLAESIPDVIWTTDTDLRFTYVSPAVTALQGWTPEEMLGKTVQEVATPEGYARAMAEFYARLALGEQTGDFSRAATLEIELCHQKGHTLWAEVTAAFMLGDDNRPIGVLGVTRDIRERIRARNEREELLASLERSKKMEALGTLAGGVAHDLNNVLSGVVSYPDLILLDLPPESPLRRRIEIIRESGKKAAAIVQDLLTLARRGVTVAENVDLNDLVREYLLSPEFNRLISFHPNVRVVERLAPQAMNVMGSPIHLGKTIMNLVSNAAEAMSTGGTITIATEIRRLEAPVRGYAECRRGDYAVLKVTDDGVGIAPEDIQRIFEPFYTKKKMGRSGTGLGMAVVWGTVQDHFGYIDVASREGEGTEITIYLPACGQPAEKAAAPAGQADLTGAGETILVVDDAREQREIAVEILGQLGYAARALPSGEAAVEYLEHARADLLILDMIMDPGIDGLETYRRIIARHPGQRAIIASGYAETDRVKTAQKLGAGTYIRKPYTVETLATAIKAELRRPPAPA
jgi:PAS domain S-box-containing protein